MVAPNRRCFRRQPSRPDTRQLRCWLFYSHAGFIHRMKTWYYRSSGISTFKHAETWHTILMKQPCLRGSYFRLIDHSLTKPKRKWRVLETVFTDVPCIPTEPEANPFGKVPLARQSYLYTSSIYHTDCTSNSNRAPTPTKGFVAWGGCSVFELWALCRVQPTWRHIVTSVYKCLIKLKLPCNVQTFAG